jgi:hypothetical protein
MVLWNDSAALAARSDDWLEFGMASFLMAQGDYCYFGAAANWYDQDWVYHAQYDWKIGRPKGKAARTGRYTWRREFENCSVSVDLERRTSNFTWPASSGAEASNTKLSTKAASTASRSRVPLARGATVIWAESGGNDSKTTVQIPKE